MGLLDAAPTFTLTKTGQTTQDDSFAKVGSSWGCDPDSTSITYLLDVESSHAMLTTGQEVTLRMEIPATGSVLSFDWTIETSAPQEEIVLKTQQGEQMGRNGDPLMPNEAAAASNTEPCQIFFTFSSPLMVDQVGTIQIGTLTGTVS